MGERPRLVARSRSCGRRHKPRVVVNMDDGGLPMPARSLLASSCIGCSQQPWQRLSLLAGLAVADCCESLMPTLATHHVHVKWPNDCLLGGRKLAGILCEAEALPGSGQHMVIVGIGLNRHADDLPTELQATGLSAYGQAPAMADVLSALRDRLAAPAALTGSAWHDALSHVRRRDALQGRSFVLRDGNGGVSQTVIGAGIDDDGQLLVVQPDGGHRRVGAGSIDLTPMQPSHLTTPPSPSPAL